jgi:hypothetical protein
LRITTTPDVSDECPTCDGTGTVSHSVTRGSALNGGGGCPVEAPCGECRPAERARWDDAPDWRRG